MTPAAIIEQAAAEGVRLALLFAGTITATGDGDAVARWLPVIRDHKPGVLAALQQAASNNVTKRQPTAAEAAELHRLVAAIYAQDSETDQAEALALALADPGGALLCYRDLAARRGVVGADDDDRRRCTDCEKLSSTGRCMAAWRGEIVAGRDYRPVAELARRCKGFKPGPHDPDQRTGCERWPVLEVKTLGGE